MQNKENFQQSTDFMQGSDLGDSSLHSESAGKNIFHKPNDLKWTASMIGIALLCYMAISNIFVSILQFSLQIFASIWASSSPVMVNKVVAFFSSQSGVWTQQLIIGAVTGGLTIFLLAKLLGMRVKGFFQRPHNGVLYTMQGCCWFTSCNFVFSVITSFILAFITMFVGHQPYSPSFEVSASQPFAVLMYFLYVIIVGPIIEELIFRGFILRSLQRFGNIFAILISSVLFGLWHGNLQQAIPIMFSGFVLGYIAIRSNSVIPGIITHAFNNLLIFFVDIASQAYPVSTINLVYYGIMAVLLLLSCFFIYFYKDNLKIYDFNQSNLNIKGRISGFLFSPGMLIFLIVIALQLLMTIFIL